MNIKKAKKLSSKVYHLIHDMDHSDDFSSIEKALVKKYLVNLFDIIDNQEESIERQVDKKPVKKEIKAPIQKEIIVQEVPKVVIETKEKELNIVEEVLPVEVEIAPTMVSETEPSNTKFLDQIIASFDSNDLAQKLSLKPISDILKAMSINERIFTLNELFEGNNDEFKECMSLLNESKSLEEAKQILMKNVVEKHDWTEAKKSKKVVKFLQLVYRKFI